jgi:hypothetical protein
MSMWLSLARLSPTAFRAVEADPSLINGLFFSEETGAALVGFAKDKDVWGMDYRTLDSMLQALYGEAKKAPDDDEIEEGDDDELPLEDEDSDGGLAPQVLDEDEAAPSAEEEDDLLEDDPDLEDLDYEDSEEARRDPLYRVSRGEGEIVSYRFNYGPAFWITPEAVAQLAEDVANEYGSEPGEAEDEDEITQLIAFLQAAATQGCYVVGGIH